MIINFLFSIVFIVCSSLVQASGAPTHFLGHFYTEVDASKIPVALVKKESGSSLDIVLMSNSCNQPEAITRLPDKDERSMFCITDE